MNDLLLNIEITPQMVYLSLILLVIGKGLKNVPFIENWSIIWILIAISMIVNFVFYGISFETLVESFIAVSLTTTLYQTYKQTGRGFTSFNKI